MVYLTSQGFFSFRCRAQASLFLNCWKRNISLLDTFPVLESNAMLLIELSLFFGGFREERELVFETENFLLRFRVGDFWI